MTNIKRLKDVELLGGSAIINLKGLHPSRIGELDGSTRGHILTDEMDQMVSTGVDDCATIKLRNELDTPIFIGAVASDFNVDIAGYTAGSIIGGTPMGVGTLLALMDQTTGSENGFYTEAGDGTLVKIRDLQSGNMGLLVYGGPGVSLAIPGQALIPLTGTNPISGIRDLSDVKGEAYSDGDILIYNTANSQFEKGVLSSVGGNRKEVLTGADTYTISGVTDFPLITIYETSTGDLVDCGVNWSNTTDTVTIDLSSITDITVILK